MGAKACATAGYPTPSTDSTRNVGSTVVVKFKVLNCSSEAGNFHQFIRKNDVICDREENVWIEPWCSGSELRCQFLMPDSVVVVKYTGGHSEGGAWIDDYEKEITLTPAGCETGCEVSCEIGCEVMCQEHCELHCEIGCEVSCEEYCEVACQSTCQLQCESACEISCESLCQVACQTSCEQYCQSSCEVGGCETTCQIGCEVSCQTVCELMCQTGCEVSCQTACETSCEIVCELFCQVGCEVACEAACEVGCEATCEISCQTATEVPTCEYTGYACDGKIADDDVPSSAEEGSTVEGSVTIDNLCLPGVDPEPTRYRVKFALDGAVTYLGECVLKNHRTTPGDYPYEMLVPFTFPMPADDVTLIAEVERCNASSEWESCEHADHIKTYTIESIKCEYTGYLCDGKIAEESVPESADEGDTVAGSVTIDNLCLGGSEHTRYRVKFTVDDDIVHSESFILKATRLSILEYPYEMAVPFSFDMPNHSVNLIVEIERCNAARIWEHAGSQYKKVYTIALKGEDEVEYKKALAYGAAAVGMYTGGSLIGGVSPKAKAVGLGLKVGTLIPAALCGLETYKIIKEKIPDWLK